MLHQGGWGRLRERWRSRTRRGVRLPCWSGDRAGPPCPQRYGSASSPGPGASSTSTATCSPPFPGSRSSRCPRRRRRRRLRSRTRPRCCVGSVSTTPGNRCWCRSTERAAGSGWPRGTTCSRLPEPRPSTTRYPPCGSPVGNSAKSRRGVHRLSSCIHRSGRASGSKPSLAYTSWASLVASRMRRTPNSARWSRTAPVSQVPSPRPRAAGSM